MCDKIFTKLLRDGGHLLRTLHGEVKVPSPDTRAEVSNTVDSGHKTTDRADSPLATHNHGTVNTATKEDTQFSL